MFNAKMRAEAVYEIIISIVHTQATNIMFGVTSRHLLNQSDTRKSEENVFLDLQNSSFWVSGKELSRNEGDSIKPGEYVNMHVDLVRYRIDWFKRKNFREKYIWFGSFMLPPNLRKVTLYPVVTMRHQNDVLRIHI
jgi:hypothetical protein